MTNLMEQLDVDLSALAERVQASLVEIHNRRRGHGAGTIWHANGLIVTNAHVVGDGNVSVTLPDGRDLPARTLARDGKRDLAALSVDASDLPTIELGDSRAQRAGQWVMAIGYPWGVAGAVTGGVVIGLAPGWDDNRPSHETIAVSLHLRPGYSGGPLVDVQGRLVGINTMMHGPDVGIAIPVHAAKQFLKDSLRT
jgi:serine protease Do